MEEEKINHLHYNNIHCACSATPQMEKRPDRKERLRYDVEGRGTETKQKPDSSAFRTAKGDSCTTMKEDIHEHPQQR